MNGLFGTGADGGVRSWVVEKERKFDLSKLEGGSSDDRTGARGSEGRFA